MKYLKLGGLIPLFAATAVMAHQGVQNATVKARMEAMSEIAANMKTLGKMAQGAIEFDAAVARTAATVIAQQAAMTTTLFAPRETDPLSEAKPLIWDDFDGFSGKAQDMEGVALAVSRSVQNIGDVKAALGALGETCKSCHAVYRAKK